jgi:hypothetical protein
MNRNTFVAIAMRAMAATAAMGFAVSPLIAVAQAPTPDPGPLASALAIAALAAEASAQSKSLPADATQAVIVTALEQTIATSGVEPLTAVSALQLTMTNMQAAGTLTPAIAAAIAEVLAKVQAAIKVQEGPGAIGPTGGPPISAPGGTGGGGGSDYRAA